MWDVISFGSATVDAFAKSKGDLIKIVSDSKETNMLAFKSGSKFLMEEPIYTLGGGGTNVAVALAKMGLKTAYFGKVGDGHNGDLVIRTLRDCKVDTSLVKRTKNPVLHTGFSIVLDNMEKDRVILAYKGANDYMHERDVDLKKLRARWFYFGSFMGDSFKTIKQIATVARIRSIKILFNPSSYMMKKGIRYLGHIMKKSEVFVCNRDEAHIFTGIDDLDETFRVIHNWGPRVIVITDGKNGVHVSDGKTIRHAKPRKKKVVDSTGAGDAFCSGFLAGMAKKDDIDFAMRLGMLNGGSVVTQVGAKNGLLTYRTALKEMKDPIVIRKRVLRPKSKRM